MKRKASVFLLLIAGMLLVASCNKGQPTAPVDTADICLYKYEPDINDFPSEVNLYEVDYWNSTEYELEDDLIKGNIVEHNIYAEGPQTVAEYRGYPEYLSYYDGGEAFFGKSDSSIDGGFLYFHKSCKQWYWDYSKAVLKWDLYGAISGVPGTQNAQLWGSEDLAFCPMKKVEEKLLDTFGKWDLSMQVLERYTINVSPEQNCYLLMFTEMIDEIPLMPYFYSEGFTKYVDWLLNCDVYAYVGEDGIMGMRVSELVQPKQMLERTKIMSLKEAKAVLEEDVRKKQYSGQVTVEDMGLYYVGMPDSKLAGYKLVPVWFFCTSVEKKVQNTEGNTETSTMEVSYELLNAIDGEWIQH